MNAPEVTLLGIHLFETVQGSDAAFQITETTFSYKNRTHYIFSK